MKKVQVQTLQFDEGKKAFVKYTPLLFEASNTGDFMKDYKHDDSMIADCNEHARKHKTYIGRMFGVPHADGKAWYQVIGETARSYQIVWIAIGDRWRDGYLDGGGSFPKARIEKFLKTDDMWLKVFKGVK
jgi:hypothetical protein